MKTKIVAVGDIGIDYYINKNLKKPGGVAFNFAMQAISPGIKVSLVSALGSDTSGKKLKNFLKKCYVNTTHIRNMQGKTAKQKIVLESNGEKKFAGYNPGVLKHWKLDEKDLKFIAEHDAIFVPLSDGMEHIFHAIRKLKTHALKCIDFSQDSEFADFDKENNIITNYCSEFGMIFIGGTEKEIRLVDFLSKQYPGKVFVLTLGSKGSIGFIAGEKFIQRPEIINRIVDTTGCGDAFQATFLVSYLQVHDIKFALQRATKSATSVIQRIGSTKFNI